MQSESMALGCGLRCGSGEASQSGAGAIAIAITGLQVRTGEAGDLGQDGDWSVYLGRGNAVEYCRYSDLVEVGSRDAGVEIVGVLQY